MGEAPAPPFQETDWLLRAFADARGEAVAGYRRFVAEGIGAPAPWGELKGQIYLGWDAFVARMQASLDPQRPLQDIPKRQRRATATPLDDYASRYPDRERALAAALP